MKHRKDWAPALYGAEQAVIQIVRLWANGALTPSAALELTTRICGAADGPWSAAIVLGALGREFAETHPAAAEKLLGAAERATPPNKPLWVEEILAKYRPRATTAPP